jgi:hypothetical protein
LSMREYLFRMTGRSINETGHWLYRKRTDIFFTLQLTN